MTIDDGLIDRVKTPDSNTAEKRTIKGVGVGDIILRDGIPERVTGYTTPEDTAGCDFTRAPLSPLEVAEYQKRELTITNMIDQQIIADPNSDINLTEMRKYWGKIYDEAAKSGKTFETVCAETNRSNFSVYVLKAKNELEIVEKQRDFAKSAAEYRVFDSAIEEKRKNLAHMESQYEESRRAVENSELYNVGD